MQTLFMFRALYNIQAPARDVLVGRASYKDVTPSALVDASARRIHIIKNGQAQTNPFYKANGDALNIGW